MPSSRTWLFILLIAILLALLPLTLPPEFPPFALAHPQVIAVASLFKQIALGQRHRLGLIKSAIIPGSSNTTSRERHTTASEQGLDTTTNMPVRMPVYFISHGGPNVMEETSHPAYAQLQEIGREITQKVKPKAIIVSPVSSQLPFTFLFLQLSSFMTPLPTQ